MLTVMLFMLRGGMLSISRLLRPLPDVLQLLAD